MQKIETKYHFITTNENEPPKYICSGLCKKAYWENKHEKPNPLVLLKCESCDGVLKTITKDEYKTIEFKITPQHTRQVVISYLSQIKPEYEEYAKTNWVK